MRLRGHVSSVPRVIPRLRAPCLIFFAFSTSDGIFYKWI
ncbi:hypothetical protein NY78_0347 [Desulfovibrio sp. TomC]|nr:hypothetical protein NY78_0347 [Desulfovibrio sp. TomC]